MSRHRDHLYDRPERDRDPQRDPNRDQQRDPAPEQEPRVDLDAVREHRPDDANDVLGLDSTFPRPGWVVVDAIRNRSITGEIVCRTTPKVTLWADRGWVYCAERESDPSLGQRLVEAEALTPAQLAAGAITVNGVEHLGKLFGRVPGIDRHAVLVANELMTDEVIGWLANQRVHNAIVTPYRHHPSGIHRWDEEPSAALAAPAPPLAAPVPLATPVPPPPAAPIPAPPTFSDPAHAPVPMPPPVPAAPAFASPAAPAAPVASPPAPPAGFGDPPRRLPNTVPIPAFVPPTAPTAAFAAPAPVAPPVPPAPPAPSAADVEAVALAPVAPPPAPLPPIPVSAELTVSDLLPLVVPEPAPAPAHDAPASAPAPAPPVTTSLSQRLAIGDLLPLVVSQARAATPTHDSAPDPTPIVAERDADGELDAVIRWDDSVWTTRTDEIPATAAPAPASTASAPSLAAPGRFDNLLTPLPLPGQGRRKTDRAEALPPAPAVATADTDPLDWLDRLGSIGRAERERDDDVVDAGATTGGQLATAAHDRFEVIWPSGEIDEQFGGQPLDAVPNPDIDRAGRTARMVRDGGRGTTAVADDVDRSAAGGVVDIEQFLESEARRSTVSDVIDDDVLAAVRNAVAEIEIGSMATRGERRVGPRSGAVIASGFEGSSVVRPGRVAVRETTGEVPVTSTGRMTHPHPSTGSVFDDLPLPSIVLATPEPVLLGGFEPEVDRASALRRLIGSLRRR